VNESKPLFAGRVVCGLGVGLGFAICPQYIAEISPPPWRGRGVVHNNRSTGPTLNPRTESARLYGHSHPREAVL